jgi:YVTN family beta-propeller protein
MRRAIVVTGVALMAAVPLVALGQPAPYRVAARLVPGGDGGWDYLTVDAPGHRLFVSRWSRVQVVDLASGRLAGEIPDTEGVHGIALAPELGVGFTSNGRAGSVTVFDLKTLATVATIKLAARNPDAILYEPVTKRVFTFNGGSHDATAIDAATRTVLGTIPLGGKPEFAVADGTGAIFDNLEDTSAIVKLDARTLKVVARWPIAPGEEPSGLAIDTEHRRLFSVCHNKLMVVLDADSGRVITTLPIGAGVDGAAFDAARGVALSSNGAGTLTVVREVSPQKFSVVADVPTQRGARTIALDPTTRRLYLPTAEFGPRPTPSPANPYGRPPIVPGSFVVLVLDPAM